MSGGIPVEQITSHVHISTEHGACTVGAIQSSGGVVLIDSPNRATGALQWREEIERLGPVRYLINTEHHVDHVFGNYFLPGTIISNHYNKQNFYQEGFHGTKSAEGPSRLLDPEGYMRDEDPEGLALVSDYRPREPEIVYRGGLTLCLGDLTIDALETAGHMPANTIVYVREDRTLFTGDNVFHNVMTWFHESVPLKWLETLDRLRAMPIDVVVPGHGKAGGPELIDAMKIVVSTAVERVQSAIDSGMTREETTERISFEDLQPVLKRLRHRLPGLQRIFVGRVYDQLQAQDA